MNQVCLKEKDVLSKKIQALEKEYPGSIGLSAGSCHICHQCTRPKDGGCRYSDEIRNFIEFLGGDVGKTAGDLLAMQLKWMKEKLPECLTLVNGFLTDNPAVEI